MDRAATYALHGLYFDDAYSDEGSFEPTLAAILITIDGDDKFHIFEMQMPGINPEGASETIQTHSVCIVFKDICFFL